MRRRMYPPRLTKLTKTRLHFTISPVHCRCTMHDTHTHTHTHSHAQHGADMLLPAAPPQKTTRSADYTAPAISSNDCELTTWAQNNTKDCRSLPSCVRVATTRARRCGGASPAEVVQATNPTRPDRHRQTKVPVSAQVCKGEQ